jgi:hypothetical protein
MCFLPPFAVEFLAEPPDQLPLGPTQPMIIDGYREQPLFPPSLGFDLLR